MKPLVFLAGFGVIATSALVTRVSQATSRASANVDRGVLAVGDVIRYQVTVSTDEETGITAPNPGKIDGFELLSQVPSSAQSINIVGGAVTKTLSITMTYRLKALKVGTFFLGPGRMSVGGKPVVVPSTLSVEVLPAGKSPGTATPGPKRRDPFDDLFLPQDDDDPPPPPVKSPTHRAEDPMAQIEETPPGTRERGIFMRVVADKKKTVLGGRVLVRLYVYTRFLPRVAVKRPPQFPDFATVDLGQQDKLWHPITIGGENWQYAAIATYAIFPLKTGTLSSTPSEMTSSIGGGFDPSAAREAEHVSGIITVEVEQPPLAGRPPGYVVGSVAHDLAVEAEVSPKLLRDGHAVLTLKLRGGGLLDRLEPILPKLPKGLKLQPTADETKRWAERGDVLGARTMRYDLSAELPGDFDLGELAFDVFDAERSAYTRAVAVLGRVTVQRGTGPTAAPSASVTVTLPAAASVSGPTGEGTSLWSSTAMWVSLPGLPLAVLTISGLSSLVARLRKKRGASLERPGVRSLALLQKAKNEDPKAKTKALLSAIDFALEDRLGESPRGLREHELAAKVAGDAVAVAAVELRAELSQLLYAGTVPGTAQFARAERLIGELAEKRESAGPLE